MSHFSLIFKCYLCNTCLDGSHYILCQKSGRMFHYFCIFYFGVIPGPQPPIPIHMEFYCHICQELDLPIFGYWITIFSVKLMTVLTRRQYPSYQQQSIITQSNIDVFFFILPTEDPENISMNWDSRL